MSEVRRADVQTFADELLAKGLSPATVSNVLNPIQAFYRRAIERDELAYNPTERIDLPTGSSWRPRRIVPPDEAAALLAALPASERPIWGTASTEYPDPYERRPDPRDPESVDAPAAPGEPGREAEGEPTPQDPSTSDPPPPRNIDRARGGEGEEP